MNFIESLGKGLGPFAAVVGRNKYLNAIKDGFVAMMPILIIGSMVAVLNNVILSWGEGSLWYGLGIRMPQDIVDFLDTLKVFGGSIWQGSLAIMALLAAFSIAYHFVKSEEGDAITGGLLSVSVFFLVQKWQVVAVPVDGVDPVTVGAINPGMLASTNIITAIIVALISAKLFCVIVKAGWTIKMPEGVPEGVARSFSALIPFAIILSIFGVLSSILSLWLNTTLPESITLLIASPLQEFGAQGPILSLIYVFLSSLLWFFGIHGVNVLSFIDTTVLTPAAAENSAALAQGIEATAFYSKGLLDSFVFLGGSGATLGLVIAIFIASKRQGDRAVAKFALAPAIFNINEPLIFGLPIVLNPIYFIPFILSQPILLFTAWAQINLFSMLGLMSNTAGGIMPWVSPVGIGAFLSYQNFTAILIAFIQLAIAILIYLPFVISSNYVKEEETK